MKQLVPSIALVTLLVVGLAAAVSATDSIVLLDDDFSRLPVGMFSTPVGPHTEYHYLPEAAPKGNWAVSCFTSRAGSQRAWHVQSEDGRHVMVQTYTAGKKPHSHPMIISGDPLWKDYCVAVELAPDSPDRQSGLVFRYRNDRCYYFFGVAGRQLVLKQVQDATGFHEPYEKVLASQPFFWTTGQYLTATVCVDGKQITASVAGGPTLRATDDTFPTGKIGLTADGSTRYRHVRVTTSRAAKGQLDRRMAERDREQKSPQAANPKPVLWKKISTEGFGVGRNLRFGDLDGDGQIDVLVGQVVHHAWPRDSYSELSCLTAMTLDGKVLWQVGKPDPEKNHLTNDVAFQIHDLDGDGKNEAIYCMNFEMIVSDGTTGRVKYRAPTPVSKPPADKYPRILGDCVYFCDLRGTGQDRDVIIKDRYWHLWALDDRLQPLWQGACRTGHYPFAQDIDHDGRDELLIGYTLFDDDGTKLWSLDDTIADHADGVAVVDFDLDPTTPPQVLYAASDAGVLWVDLEGHILEHHFIGHGQNPAVANFRDDLPGLETISINFWGNQGIIHFYDWSGRIYHDFEPNQYGSMCLPINWTGKSEEFFVHSPNVAEGGMFDGWGRKVVQFPDDGHPDMCNAVLDIMGDCRDEVVVWDPHQIWVYTQDDNPRSGRLYQPRRNPLYNYSNYQATVSLPGWCAARDSGGPRRTPSGK